MEQALKTDEATPETLAAPVAARVSAGIAATTVVALPTMLVGGLGILIQRDLGFGEAQLGAAVAASFVGGAIVAMPAGRIVERFGPRRTTLLGLTFGFASLLGIALVASTWVGLVVFLVLAGVGITTVQLGVNVLVARAVPPPRQGLAYGAKQAAVPLASLLAGLAVPVMGISVGWQPVFLVAALIVPLVALGMPDAPPTRPRDEETSAGTVPLNALVLLTLGVALASAGGNSAPVFIVPSAVDRGIAPAYAGLVLALGSTVGIVVRVAGGWLADRLGRGSLLLVAALVAIGAVGFLGLAVAEQPLLIAAFTVLVFGGGWGWGGLILLALARTNPTAPGRAMGVVQVGPMTGAVLGPLVFGAVAEHVAFGAAWAVMALFSLCGVATILVSRRRLLGPGPSPSAPDRARG